MPMKTQEQILNAAFYISDHVNNFDKVMPPVIYLSQRGKVPAASVRDITLNNLMARLQ